MSGAPTPTSTTSAGTPTPNGGGAGAAGGSGGNNGSGNKNKPVESLSEIFRCFICMEKLRGAHMCSHCSKLCCFTCIQRWLESSNHCPHCRASLLPHEVIKCRWAEEVTQQLDTLIKTATTSASVPGLLMPDKGGRSSTSLLDAIMMTHLDSDRERCATHAHELLSVYCTTCKRCICHQCALWAPNHKDHAFKPIDEIYNDQCQLIKDHVMKLRRRFMEIIGSIQEIEKNIDYATTTKDIYVREIRHSVEQMISRLDSYLKSRLMTLVNQKGHLNRKSEEIDNLLQEIESQLASCPKSELIGMSARFVTIIDETLQRCTYNTSPVTIDFQSEIIPKYSTQNIIVNQFSALRKKGEPFYSESLQVYGHLWRLKVYPNGNGVVRGSYLSLFLELTAGPSEIAKYEYRIEMIYQNGFDSTKNMLREFSSDFEVGECWGYNRFFRLDLLESEGFWIPDVDVLQLRFDVRPTTYYQKCKDMDWYIRQLQINQVTLGAAAAAGANIESSLTPLLSELSSRMGKMVVRNGTGGHTGSNNNPQPSTSCLAAMEIEELLAAVPPASSLPPPPMLTAHMINNMNNSSNSASGAAEARQLNASNLRPSSGREATGTNAASRRNEHQQLSRHPPLIHTSPTTTTLMNISSYLNNAARNAEENQSDNDAEPVPSSSFYDEYLQILGVENTASLPDPENYFLAQDDNDEEEEEE